MNNDTELDNKFKKAVDLLTNYPQLSNDNNRKPVLPHDIRVGTYLREKGYAEDIVLAGVLHDALEWYKITEQKLREEFGDKITDIVLANTKDDSIKDKQEKTSDLIKRCVKAGQEALIVKTADVIDSFKWYTSQKDERGIQYSIRHIDAILKFKPDNFNDKIFNELCTYHIKQ